MRVPVSRNKDMRDTPYIGMRCSSAICVVFQLPSPKKHKKIAGLFERATGGTDKFLDACWETKYLATTDLDRARNEFRRLAKQTLASQNTVIPSEGAYVTQLSNMLTLIETKQSDAELTNALKELRVTYLKSVLHPAVRNYMKDTSKPAVDVKKLYDNVAMMNGLLGVVDFFGKIEQP